MKAIPLLLFIVSIQTGFTQDKIYKRDKSVIEAKVKEVSRLNICASHSELPLYSRLYEQKGES